MPSKLKSIYELAEMLAQAGREHQSIDLHLHLSPELTEQVELLVPQLLRKGVTSLSLSSYHRPGEPRFWLAYLYVAGRRHVCATPDLRHQTLDEQWPELVCQLSEFEPREARVAPGGSDG